MTTARQLADITEVAEILCDPRQHTEPVFEWDTNRHRGVTRGYTSVQDGLLTQLAEVAQNPVNGDQPSGRPEPSSRPPVNLDALSRYTVITIAVTRWCWSLRIEIRDTVESNVRALVGAAGGLDDDTAAALLAEMMTWMGWAADLTGWRTSPYSPYVPCPEEDCRRIGTLRVDLARRRAKCVACRSTWDSRSEGIDDLAAYVRSATAGSAAS